MKIKQIDLSLSLFNCLTFMVLFVVICLPSISKANTYCPAGGGFINPGMTIAQVRQACGAPSSTTKKQTYATRNVAIKQLIYNIHQQSITYGVPNINTTPVDGHNYTYVNSEPQTASLMITIVANKVTSISLNNSQVQGSSLCTSGTIQVGSSLAAVGSACGAPSYVNNSFQKRSQGKSIKEEIWIIKTNEYSSSLRLTFHDGILQSIQK